MGLQGLDKAEAKFRAMSKSMACIRFINETQADLHVVELGRMQGPFPSSGSGSTLSLQA